MLKSSVVAPFDQRKSLGPRGKTLRFTAPFSSPQFAGAGKAVAVGGLEVLATVKLAVAVQLPPAETVTV